MAESKGYFVADAENDDAWIDADLTCADFAIPDDTLQPSSEL